MDLNKLLLYISPFTALAFCGLIAIGYGFYRWGEPWFPLQFMSGIPLLIFPLLVHWFIVNRCKDNAARVWLAEGIFVAIGAFIFYRS